GKGFDKRLFCGIQRNGLAVVFNDIFRRQCIVCLVTERSNVAPIEATITSSSKVIERKVAFGTIVALQNKQSKVERAKPLCLNLLECIAIPERFTDLSAINL